MSLLHYEALSDTQKNIKRYFSLTVKGLVLCQYFLSHVSSLFEFLSFFSPWNINGDV